jgi:hypothetical protein
MVALENCTELNGSGLLKALLELQRSWRITDSEAGILVRAAIPNKSSHAAVWDTDQMERMGYLFAIDKILTGIFTEQQKQTWLRTTQAANIFGQQSVLQKMLLGRVADLYVIERWLRSRLELM